MSLFNLINNRRLYFGNTTIEIPAPFRDKSHDLIYGTSTCGLITLNGKLLYKHGDSGEVITPIGLVGGRLLEEDLQPQSLVYLREQLKVEDAQTFWLISKSQIEPQLNWVNIQYENGVLLRICPFTFEYKVL